MAFRPTNVSISIQDISKIEISNVRHHKSDTLDKEWDHLTIWIWDENGDLIDSITVRGPYNKPLELKLPKEEETTPAK